MFSDDFRDGVKGSVFEDEECGYVNGNASELSEMMKSVISGGIYRMDVQRKRSECWTDTPQQVVNYVEAHDNLTLFDKLRISMPEASGQERVSVDKLAAALVFLSEEFLSCRQGRRYCAVNRRLMEDLFTTATILPTA